MIRLPANQNVQYSNLQYSEVRQKSLSMCIGLPPIDKATACAASVRIARGRRSFILDSFPTVLSLNTAEEN